MNTALVLILVALVCLYIGNCSGRKTGMEESEDSWKKERKALLEEADSLHRLSISLQFKAQGERRLSEEREQRLLNNLKSAKRADSIAQIKLKQDLRYYRSLINRPISEIQNLMKQEYENDTAYHNSLLHPG